MSHLRHESGMFDVMQLPKGASLDSNRSREIVMNVADSVSEKFQRLREAMVQYEKMTGKTPTWLYWARKINTHDNVMANMEANQIWAENKHRRNRQETKTGE